MGDEGIGPGNNNESIPGTDSNVNADGDQLTVPYKQQSYIEGGPGRVSGIDDDVIITNDENDIDFINNDDDNDDELIGDSIVAEEIIMDDVDPIGDEINTAGNFKQELGDKLVAEELMMDDIVDDI